MLKFNLSILCFFMLIAATIAQEILPMIGGEHIQEKGQCLLDVDRQEIKKQLRENIYRLEQEGLISPPNKLIVSFEWPLAKADNFTFNSYYNISNYVDHNPVATGTQNGASNLDYNCGSRTYDSENGYNHAGTDFSLWPFEWYLMENDFVEVVAAAPGVIIDRRDGFEDDHCSCEGFWNAIYVRHNDGSVAWYGHMKKNSLTSKGFGDIVETGEYLGVVASSGCSTGPHLHFEVYDSGDNLIDPYAGSCNSLNTATWWADQSVYNKSTLNAVLTHSEPPSFGCPTDFEIPNLKNYFQPLDEVCTAFYYVNQKVGQMITYRILTPSGQLFQQWSQTFQDPFFNSYWYRIWLIPSDAEIGEWTLQADYEGETITHNFYVGISATHDLGATAINIFPNPTSDKIFVESDDKNLFVRLYDAQGKLLISQKEMTVDMSTFSKGIYFLAVQDHNGNNAVQKIVKL